MLFIRFIVKKKWTSSYHIKKREFLQSKWRSVSGGALVGNENKKIKYAHYANQKHKT